MLCVRGVCLENTKNSVEKVERRMKEYIVKDMTGEFEDKDYPELIRCKDCRWFLPSECKSSGWCSFSQHGYPSADDYCSDAEGKKE